MDHEYGNFFPTSIPYFDLDLHTQISLICHVLSDAKEVIGEEKRCKIITKRHVQHPSWDKHIHGVAWYSIPELYGKIENWEEFIVFDELNARESGSDKLIGQISLT